jgi:hypothetical protein
MWPFKGKKNKVKRIEGPAWGYLVNEYHIDVDTLFNEMRCVQKEGVTDKKEAVTYVRVFKPHEAAQKGIEVEGWESLDEHPELINFEGYEDYDRGSAYLEQKND